MSCSGLLYANSTAITGTDGVWIAVADADGSLLAHEQLVGHTDIEFVNLLAVKLAAGLLADPYAGVDRGVIVTDSTQAVGAVHLQSAHAAADRARPPARGPRRRDPRILGIGWIVAWAPRSVNLATTALATHLRDSATTPTTTEAP